MALTDRAKTLLLGAIGDQPSTQEIIQLLELAGTGNMTGPGTATNNALPRFDGVTGALLKNSGVIVDNSNNVSGIGTLNAGATTITSLSLTNGILTSPAATNLLLQAAGVTGISINSSTLASTFSGNILFGTDNTFTLGTSTSGRPTKGFASQQFVTGDVATFAGSFPVALPNSKGFYAGANTGEAGFAAEAFTVPAVLRLRYANGTNTAPTGITNGQTMGNVLLQAWDGVSAYGTGLALSAVATQNWTATTRGTIGVLATIKQGESVRTDRMYFGEGAFVSIAPNNNFYSFTDGSSNIGQSTDNRFNQLFLKLNAAAGNLGTHSLSGSVLFANTQGFGAFGNNNAGIQSDTYGAGVQGEFVHFHARGTNTAPTAIQLNDSLGAFSTGGFNGTTWQIESARRNFQIVTFANENFTTSAMGVRVNFNSISNGTIVPLNRFQITGDGNLSLNNSNLIATTDGTPTIGLLGANRFSKQYLTLLDAVGPVGTAASSWTVLHPTFPTQYVSSNSGNPSFVTESYTAGSAPRFIAKRARGTNTAPTAILSGDNTGAITFDGYDGTAFTEAALEFRTGATENWSATNHGTGLQIRTTKSGAGEVAADRIVIDGNGDTTIIGNVYTNLGMNVGSSGLFPLNAVPPFNNGLLQVGSEGAGGFPGSIVELGSSGASGDNPAHVNFTYSPDGTLFFSSNLAIDETTYELSYVTSGAAFNFHSNINLDGFLNFTDASAKIANDAGTGDLVFTAGLGGDNQEMWRMRYNSGPGESEFIPSVNDFAAIGDSSTTPGGRLRPFGVFVTEILEIDQRDTVPASIVFRIESLGALKTTQKWSDPTSGNDMSFGMTAALPHQLSIFDSASSAVVNFDDSGNIRATGSLGVGNSVAATTPGSVTKKIEIFDAAGVSLGFIAVYDAIT